VPCGAACAFLLVRPAVLAAAALALGEGHSSSSAKARW
jgi:hypothetical protein